VSGKKYARSGANWFNCSGAIREYTYTLPNLTYDTVKANVLGFKDDFSYNIQLCLQNDHAYDKFSGKED
jgi:hypothetical protein